MSERKITRKKIDDLVGKRFGKLTVIKKEQESIGKPIKWVCKCDCDNIHKVSGSHLINEKIKSCGCIRYESKVDYEIFDSYVIGKTLNGNTFQVDVEDYQLIKEFNWLVDKEGYIVATRNNKRVIMSHLIMKPNSGQVVDHIDHDTSNNKKGNLRICSLSQNAMNRKRPSHNTSGKKGVSFHKDSGKWRAYITVNGKTICLGKYNSLDDAIKARVNGEEKYHGEFSYFG